MARRFFSKQRVGLSALLKNLKTASLTTLFGAPPPSQGDGVASCLALRIAIDGAWLATSVSKTGVACSNSLYSCASTRSDTLRSA
jgi:hypothetical protein